MSKLPNSNSDTKDRPPSTPRWVKVSGIITIVLILLFVIMMSIGGGKNNPGRHGPGNHGTGGESVEQIEQKAPEKHAPSDGGHKSPGGGH